MKELFIHEWKNVENPKGVVQIFHGMAEHGARYADFAEYLNKAGYIVFADDHRGHGKTAGAVEELGCIGKDGFNKIVEDERFISLRIRREYPGLPLFIFAHSFGSFVAQDYITRYGKEIEGVMLSGTALMDGPEVGIAKSIAWIQKLFMGERRKSKLIDKMNFSSNNKGIENPKTKFDWLTRDDECVKKYAGDNFCGTVFTTGFYYYFTKGLQDLCKEEKLAEIPEDLPIMIFVGAEDPVGGNGKLAIKLNEKYKQLGIKDNGIKLYPGARHEILNELNRQEVYEDVLAWISKHN